VQKRKVLSEKRKITLKEKHRAYNKRLRQRYLHSAQLTFDDFVDYLQGYYKKTQIAQSIKSSTLPKVRKSEFIPSLSAFKESATGLTGRSTKKN